MFVTERGGAPGVVRISTATGKVAAHWTVETRGVRSSEPSGIAAGAGSVWLARGAEVVRVDAETGRVQHRFPLAVTATLLQFAGGDLWAASSENGRVEKIDPAVDRIVARATLHGWLSAMTVAGGSVWVTAVPDDVVFRLNVDDASVEGQTRGVGGAESLAAIPGAIVVAGSRERALARLDIASGRRAVIALTGSPELVRHHDGLLWTAATAEPALPAAASGPEVRVAVAEGNPPLDPASGVDPIGAQLHYATCMKLVNYPDAAGAAGQRLRPEAAAALPSRSADGRTYTLPDPRRPALLAAVGRAGQRRRVQADARAHALARARARLGRARDRSATSSAPRPTAAAGPRTCAASSCAVRSSRSRRACRPATSPPGSRCRSSARSRPARRRPATRRVRSRRRGPTTCAPRLADRLVLDRNPNYRGPRPRRPARIVYLTGVPAAKAVALADGGQADVVPWDFDLHGPVAPGGALAAQRDRAAATTPWRAPGVDLLAFNTRRPLFRDARLRRAVNYALDRPALAGIYGEAVTDRYVPPAVPGARRSAVYPLSGPDLVRARALAGSGPARTARLYFCGDPVEPAHRANRAREPARRSASTS